VRNALTERTEMRPYWAMYERIRERFRTLCNLSKIVTVGCADGSYAAGTSTAGKARIADVVVVVYLICGGRRSMKCR